jgi:hypothetical protein
MNKLNEANEVIESDAHSLIFMNINELNEVNEAYGDWSDGEPVLSI